MYNVALKLSTSQGERVYIEIIVFYDSTVEHFC